MNTENPPPLFLNPVIQRLNKIRIYEELINCLPYFEGKSELAPADERSTMNRLLTQAEDGLQSAAPYQFLPEAASSVLNDKKSGIDQGISLPSSITWLDICTGDGQKTESGALLFDDGNGKITINLFILKMPGLIEAWPISLANITKRIMSSAIGVFTPSVAPAKRKFAALGKHERMLIVPNIVFDGSKIIVPMRNEHVLLPLYIESPAEYPILFNYRSIIGKSDQKQLMAFRDDCINLAETSLRLAQAVAKNDPRIEIITSKSEQPEGKTLADKAPERKASVVAVNPDFQKAPKVGATNAATPPTSSLADFVVETGQRSTSYWREAIRPIGRELIVAPKHGKHGAKRFVIDKTTEDILAQMSDIPFENFVAQYRHIHMPFDSIWIENTVDEQIRGQHEAPQRHGYLIKRSGEIIITKYAAERIIPDTGKQAIKKLGGYIRNGNVVAGQGVDIVLSEKGISAPGGQSLKDYYEANFQRGPKLDLSNSTDELADSATKTAQYLFRFLVLISNKNVETNIWDYQSDQTDRDINSIELNPLWLRLGDEVERALKAGDTNAVKELLGWTDGVLDHTPDRVANDSTPPTSSLADFVIRFWTTCQKRMASCN